MILACHNLSKSFGDQVIVKDGSFHIENHEKAALVGLNGAGKSTILKMIVGQLSPDAGTVVLTKGKTLGYLAQHQEMESGNTIYEEVRTAKAEVIEMEKQIRTIEIELPSLSGDALEARLATYQRLTSAFEHADGYAYKSELTGVLKGLGFTEEESDFMKINTLYELLRHGVEKFASRTAFDMFNGESVTYAEVGRRAAAVQEALVGAGVKAGDKVALLSSSMPNWGICYLAVTSAGMVAVPILPDFSGPELDMIIAHSEAKALLVSDKLFSKLSKQTIDSLNIVIRTKNLGIIAQHVTATGSTAVPSPDDLAAIIYTSGTTSSPKGVMLTHKAICAQIDMDFGIFPIDETDVFLSVLPLSHTYECSIGLIYAFSKGARVVYLDRQPTASALMPALKAVRPTVMLIVPLIIEKIYRHQVLAKFNSNSFWRTLYRIGFMRRYLHRVAGGKLMKLFGGRLRFLGIGGAKLDGGAEKFLLEARVPYAIGYGLTETAPLLAGAAPSMVRLGSTGPQAPGVELRLENVNPETRQGEIVARTPSAMVGYFKNPEATKEVFTADGWFRTGDLGELDKDGWLYIKGRLKNMIVGPGGENIYPEDIETVLNSHVCIADSIVTEQEGRLIALVHFNREEIESMIDDWREEWESKKEAWEAKTEQLKKEIMDFVNAKVNRFSRISEVVEEKEDFIKTPTHKIKRFLYNKNKNGQTPDQPAAGK